MADELATARRRRIPKGFSFFLSDLTAVRAIRMHFDGGRRVLDHVSPSDVAVSGGGWLLWVALDLRIEGGDKMFDALRFKVDEALVDFEKPLRSKIEGRLGWLVVACSSFHIGACTTMQAEARAAMQGLLAAAMLLNKGRVSRLLNGYLDVL